MPLGQPLPFQISDQIRKPPRHILYRILAARLSTTKTGREYKTGKEMHIFSALYITKRCSRYRDGIYGCILTISYSIAKVNIMAGLNSKFFVYHLLSHQQRSEPSNNVPLPLSLVAKMVSTLT
jgi:hypothetical protein